MPLNPSPKPWETAEPSAAWQVARPSWLPPCPHQAPAPLQETRVLLQAGCQLPGCALAWLSPRHGELGPMNSEGDPKFSSSQCEPLPRCLIKMALGPHTASASASAARAGGCEQLRPGLPRTRAGGQADRPWLRSSEESGQFNMSTCCIHTESLVNRTAAEPHAGPGSRPRPLPPPARSGQDARGPGARLRAWRPAPASRGAASRPGAHGAPFPLRRTPSGPSEAPRTPALRAPPAPARLGASSGRPPGAATASRSGSGSNKQPLPSGARDAAEGDGRRGAD